MSFLLFGGRCGYLLIGLARGEDVVTWDAFTASLGSSHVSISEKEDSIIGQKIPLGSVLQRLVIKLFALGKSWRNQHGGGN
jgi:hypothetical protein